MTRKPLAAVLRLGPAEGVIAITALGIPAFTFAAGEEPAAAAGPWLFAAVALVLVAGLAYVAGLRSPRRPPQAKAPSVVQATEPPAGSAPNLALLRRVLDMRPAHLCLWMRKHDGHWQAVIPTAAPAEPARADVPGAGVVQAAGQCPAGDLQRREGWLFLREDVDTTAWLLAWREHAPADASREHAAQESASFSYTVSHDLRAPLRAVDGFTRILKEDYGRQLDRIGNDHLDRVLAAAARMNAMIDAMLSLAKLSSQPLARQPVNLSQLAAYIAEDLRRSTPDRQVHLDIEPGLQVTGDPTLLRQVLENLLANAWKYTGRCEEARIRLRSRTMEGRRVFEVSDNGAGFDMRSAERLFGLFQRLHSANEFPGTGVGLASVKRIVLRHGGDIWAESEPGQGARFFFTLES